MKREQILANRIKWIEFLKQPGRKKTRSSLDDGGGNRCCLGHGCYVLGVTRINPMSKSFAYVYGEEKQGIYAPQEFIEAVGLWDSEGSPYNYNSDIKIDEYWFESLAQANDAKEVFHNDSLIPCSISPQQIGEYLESVIKGGKNTPFKLLSSYKEAK